VHLSLRVRLSLAFAVGAAILVAIGVSVVSTVLTRSVDDAIDSELRSRLADVSAAAVERADAVIHADQFAQVIQADGKVLADSSFGERGAVLAGPELAAALAGPRRVDRAVDGLGPHARLDSTPVTTPSGPAVVVVGSDAGALSSARSRARLVMYLAPPIAALALGAAAWVLVGAALRPVTELADEAARLSTSRLGRRLPVPHGDHEVAALATSLNSLLAAVESAMATERQFLDDASHELRTPLTVVRGEVELAQLALANGSPASVEEARQSVDAAAREAERLTALAEDLLVLARLDRGELRLRRRAVNLRHLAEEVVARLGTERPATTVTGDDVLVNADRQRLEQVIGNLVANARTYARSRVLVTVVGQGAEGARIEVADDGPGFPPHLADTAFARFRRADRARGGRRIGTEGTGLGLAIVAAVVDAHDGSVAAATGPPLGGAVVTVRLPTGSLSAAHSKL
jgi:signal transduction histidine kinase